MKLLIFLSFLILGTPVNAILRPKLQVWFPQYEEWWIVASGKCEQELFNYHTHNRTFTCPSPCACAVDCILSDIPTTITSNFASAQVLLGLTPTILVFFGPSIAETAALSTYRPGLAMLLALGSPAVHITRLLASVDVKEPFSRPTKPVMWMWARWMHSQNPEVKLCWRFASYCIALAAIANNVTNSVYMDLRTVSGWRCAALLMPLVWSLLAIIVHGWGMIAVRLRSRNGSPLSLTQLFDAQVYKYVMQTEETALSELLSWMSLVCGVIHMVFGILDLSSLIFIGAFEALGVFVRYAVSAFVCQAVLLLELTRMRFELDETEEEKEPKDIMTVLIR